MAKFKKYDIVKSDSFVCVYIGRTKIGNYHCIEPIFQKGSNMNNYFPNYDPVVARTMWGYPGIQVKLLEARNGVKPTLEYIKEKYGN